MYFIPPNSSKPRWMPCSSAVNAEPMLIQTHKSCKQAKANNKRKRLDDTDDHEASLIQSLRFQEKWMMHPLKSEMATSHTLLIPSDSEDTNMSDTSDHHSNDFQSSRVSYSLLNNSDRHFTSHATEDSGFPEQCLRLAIETPTGHPHPYNSPSSLPTPNSSQAPLPLHKVRSELGAGYFDYLLQ